MFRGGYHDSYSFSISDVVVMMTAQSRGVDAGVNHGSAAERDHDRHGTYAVACTASIVVEFGGHDGQASRSVSRQKPEAAVACR